MIFDIHTHTAPDVDDGSDTIEMSMEMLWIIAKQECNQIFATPHSEAFDYGDHEHTYQQIRLLQHNAELSGIPVRIFMGCEIETKPEWMEDNLAKLRDHIYPSMNGSKYILSEFHTKSGNFDDALFCLTQYLNNGWIPIIAHAERYNKTFTNVSNIKRLKELGCLVQINLYSLEEESDPAIKQCAQKLLEEELVDFVGSDGHGTVHRPPAIEKGAKYIREYCRKEYAERILWKNAVELLGIEESAVR